MGDKLVDPRGLRGSRSADPQLRIYAFDRLGCLVIKRKIGGLFQFAVPEINVRFVPDLEVSLLHFVLAVAIEQMVCKGCDQGAPFGRVFGWRRERLVPEGMRRQIGGQLARHKAQFHKGLHARFSKPS
jgi:hypothetical protein